MTSVLKAIVNIINNPNYEIRNLYSGRNRANNIGEALENFVKDSFAGSLNIMNEQERLKKHNDVFSWLGNQNHPPDIMIKEGDAIEVKKTQSANSDLALNSSYPKSNIRSDSEMITQECKECEKWNEKDLIYCVGHTSDESINSLWFVYGNVYAAKHETYQIIKEKISKGIQEIPNVEFAVTNELGRVNRVDPLGITNLRIRGMWQIQNPRKVFNYLYSSTLSSFELVALIPISKYDSFPQDHRKEIESLKNKGFKIENKLVKDPNNPAKLIDIKLITFQLE